MSQVRMEEHIHKIQATLQIVSDNGKQFDNPDFGRFCAYFGVEHTKVVVAYPKANRKVENTNRTILDGIARKVKATGSTWYKELTSILWAYRTTQRRAIDETPFALTYSCEARVLIEALVPLGRAMQYDPGQNNENLKVELNLLGERCMLLA